MAATITSTNIPTTTQSFIMKTFSISKQKYNNTSKNNKQFDLLGKTKRKLFLNGKQNINRIA